MAQVDFTTADYNLFTGQCVDYDDTQWATIVSIAKKRLASFLCLPEFPALDGDNKDLAMLLANFIAAVFKFSGDSDTIASKSVRNFTINFKSSATNAFSQIYSQYEDIIEMYSKCGTGLKVERSACGCCHRGYLNF